MSDLDEKARREAHALLDDYRAHCFEDVARVVSALIDADRWDEAADAVRGIGGNSTGVLARNGAAQRLRAACRMVAIEARAAEAAAQAKEP